MRSIWILLPVACLATACGSTAAEADRTMPITTSSQEARELFLQARDLLENIEPESATKLLDQAIARDSAFAMAHALRAQAGGMIASREHLDEAVRLADQVSEAERHWILGMKTQVDADTPTLKTHLDALVAAYPDDRHVQQRVGFYHSGIRGDDATAVTHFRKATEIDPMYAPAWNSLGYSQMATGDYAGAEASFKRYIELLPDRPNPYDSYAEFLMKRGRFDESITAYQQALERDAAFPGSHAGIGANLVFKGEFEQAREAYQQQLVHAPRPADKVAAMRNAATTFVYEGRTEDAVKVIDAAGALARESGLEGQGIGAQFDAAFILAEAGLADRARERLDAMASAIDASSLPDAVKARLRLNHSLAEAHVHALQGRSAQATEVLERIAPTIAQRNNPFESERLHEARGLVALHQKHYADAAGHLAQSGTNDPYVLYQRAAALEGAGRAAEAATLYKQVADWNESSLGYAIVRARARAKVTG
jgi:tetratricopeptide (TPR) repeat protein